MIEFTQKSVAPEIEHRLHCVLEPWLHTPYRAGKQEIGIACDCRSFVLGVLDELYGRKTDLQLLPEDASLHRPEVARAFLRDMARLWQVEKVENLELEPGDVIISAYPKAGPTHVMIAGKWPWFYHASPSGVEKCGFRLSGLDFYGHYRLPDKETWVWPKQ